MNIIRGFLPFILFWVLVRQIDLMWALWAAAGLALIQMQRGVQQHGRNSIKLLDACAAVLFLALAGFVTFVDRQVSPFAVRMTVDSALALIAIGSMLIGRPFTLQYAREQVSPELWNSPLFISTNYWITGVWSAAFVVQALANAAAVIISGVPPALPAAVGVAALVGAVLFTIEYPKRVRARARAGSATPPAARTASHG